MKDGSCSEECDLAHIAFVQNLSFEYLGVMYLSAMLKEHGHKVEVFIVTAHEDNAIDEINRFGPDLIAFSCTTGIHNWVVSFAKKLKKNQICPIVMGGPHATFFPEVIKEASIDIICRGEGEHAICDLANAIDKNEDYTNTKNCWFKVDGTIIENEQRHLIEDLDTLPFADRQLYADKYPFLNRSQKVFIGGRGCPFDCSFCFNHAYKKLYHKKGAVVRFRSVDNLIKEIQEVQQHSNVRTVYFQDDTFILNKQWVAEFTSKYISKINLPFVCLVRADLADEATLIKLSEAGCKNVFFGIESGDESLRQILLKKRVSDKQIIDAAHLMKACGIRFRTYNIFGLPGETLEQALKTVKLNIEIGTDYPWSSLFNPFPGTELAQYAYDKGYLDQKVNLNSPSFFKDSVLKSKDKNAIINLHKLFFYCVKFPFLIPLIKKVIPYKTNILFDCAFLFGYAWCYFRSENLTMREMFSVGMRNIKSFIFPNATS